MTENNDPSAAAPQTPTPPATPTTPPAAEVTDAPARRTFRERLSGAGARLNGTRGLIAATLAALVVGGFGGAAIHAAVSDDHDDHGRFFRGDRPGEMGGGFGDFGGRMDQGERPGPPGGFFPRPPDGEGPGQLPPSSSPEDEDSSPTPSPSPSESSSS